MVVLVLLFNLQECVGEVRSGVASLSWRPYQVQVCCWPPMLALPMPPMSELLASHPGLRLHPHGDAGGANQWKIGRAEWCAGALYIIQRSRRGSRSTAALSLPAIDAWSEYQPSPPVGWIEIRTSWDVGTLQHMIIVVLGRVALILE